MSDPPELEWSVVSCHTGAGVGCLKEQPMLLKTEPSPAPCFILFSRQDLSYVAQAALELSETHLLLPSPGAKIKGTTMPGRKGSEF